MMDRAWFGRMLSSCTWLSRRGSTYNLRNNMFQEHCSYCIRTATGTSSAFSLKKGKANGVRMFVWSSCTGRGWFVGRHVQATGVTLNVASFSRRPRIVHLTVRFLLSNQL